MLLFIDNYVIQLSLRVVKRFKKRLGHGIVVSRDERYNVTEGLSSVVGVNPENDVSVRRPSTLEFNANNMVKNATKDRSIAIATQHEVSHEIIEPLFE
jgi:hypothetical protein